MKEVTAIFDIGKTNKKLLLFDAECNIVYEYSEVLPETKDDDGFPCEDIKLLTKWILEKWQELISKKAYYVSAVNFTAYGASLVHLDKNGEPVTPLYNYLKPLPLEIVGELYERYGGKWNFSAVTSSPPMGMLNSGLQLLWLKKRKPELFKQIAVSLHLPQYLAFIFSRQKISEYTSIGCHTALWDFTRNKYHQWVVDEGIDKILAPINSNPVMGILNLEDKKTKVGGGLHDSSSALIPYLQKFKEPFLLISTGTWCITLNPFNNSPLTKEELSLDCLCYLTSEGKPVRAARIFLGKELEFQTARIENHFEKTAGYCQQLKHDAGKIHVLLDESNSLKKLQAACMEGTGPFPAKPLSEWDLSYFSSCEEAYLQLLLDLTSMLCCSVQLADNNIKTVFVEGGFGDNEIFMNLLANHFPHKKIKTSLLKQATALGAVMHIKQSWEPLNWKFREYEPLDISSGLENYRNKNYRI